MSEPFLGQISIVAFNFAPRGFALCDGQILPINQNQSLYSLLGTTYGGDGRTTFALPDLRGRTPIHVGDGHQLGSKGGGETETLSVAQMPQHTHLVNASNSSDSSDPQGIYPGRGAADIYGALANPGAMGSGTITNSGGGQVHENMQPYLVINFVIALQGLFPSRN